MTAAELLDSHKDILIADVMSNPVLTVEVSESLWDAWQLLFVSGLRHLVVINEDGACMGVLSDRNILAEVPATAENLGKRKVSEVMAMVPLVSAKPMQSPIVAARIMAENAIEAVPVLDDRDRLVGIVTEFDIVRWLVR
ncbi:MAG: CBS domain-containing protein [Actinomycetes bacterium]